MKDFIKRKKELLRKNMRMNMEEKRIYLREVIKQ